MKIYLNRDWDFTEVFSERLFDCPWGTKKVSIPHTCKETPFHYFDEQEYQMISGYRKELDVPADKTVIENIYFSDSLLALGYYLSEHLDEVAAKAAKLNK